MLRKTIIGNQFVEFLLALYILSGTIKAFLAFFQIDFFLDFTLFSGILLLISLFANRVVNKPSFNSSRINKPLLWMLLFWGWMIVSLVYTSSPSYSYKKTFLFLTTMLPAFVILYMRRFNINIFLRCFVVLSFLSTILFLPIQGQILAGLDSNEDLFRTTIEGLQLSFGECIGTIAVLFIVSNATIFTKLVDKVVIFVSFIFLLILGARGPLIIAVACATIYYIFIKKKFFSFLSYSIAAIALLFIVIPFIENVPIVSDLYHNSMARLELIIDGVLYGKDMGNSVDLRVSFIYYSIDSIMRDVSNFLFGTGVGSFGIEYFHNDIRAYPHNLILETWFELGLVGLALLIGFFVSTLKGFAKKHIYITALVLLYVFMNWLKSSSLVDIRTGMTFFLLYSSIWNTDIALVKSGFSKLSIRSNNKHFNF